MGLIGSRCGILLETHLLVEVVAGNQQEYYYYQDHFPTLQRFLLLDWHKVLRKKDEELKMVRRITNEVR